MENYWRIEKSSFLGKSWRLVDCYGVILVNKKSQKWFVILISCLEKNRELIRLINQFTKGWPKGDRARRFMRIYFFYEQLTNSPNQVLKAVRDRLSHPILNNRNALKVINKIFRADEIEYTETSHGRKLQKLIIEMLDECNSLLSIKLLKAIKLKKRNGIILI